MFSELKSIVDLIRSAISDFRKFKTDQEREEIVLGVIRTYFVLKDCIEDGEKLITEAGPDPITKIKAMDPTEAKRTLEIWVSTLKKQGIRLRTLQGFIFDQNHLAIINPKLQEQISEIIGYKMDRTDSLHGLGAGLFFMNLLPIDYSDEEKVGLVTLMAGAEDNDLLDLQKIDSEVAALRNSLDEYRTVVERLVSNDELLILSNRARRETLFQDER
ncbi:MAG: hypothetical protein NTY36_02295 [Deltaproteobacteria bacterium]|nr:hypothetical protein [Deltaproteobacteria bacterium]